VASSHLRPQPIRDSRAIERFPLFPDHDLKGEIEEEIAEFVAEGLVVAGINRVDDFV
jgi:hypothetical protein